VTDGTTALVEPLAVAWHAVKISPFQAGDSALVLGGGPIGLAVTQVLKALGAKTIIVSEIAERRRQFACDFGAHAVLDPTKDNIIAQCRNLTGGRGVHVAFDAAGAQAGLETAIHSVRVRGAVVNIAIWETQATINPNLLVLKERSYLGAATYQKDDFQEVIDAISSGEEDTFKSRSQELTDSMVVQRRPSTRANDHSDN
jgi:threonine dehydrogenase-like Zn-dependent dehydrogenase